MFSSASGLPHTQIYVFGTSQLQLNSSIQVALQTVHAVIAVIVIRFFLVSFQILAQMPTIDRIESINGFPSK